MNKDQLKKNKGVHVRLRPMSLRADREMFLPQIDDDWSIESVSDDGVRLFNIHSNHIVLVAYDQIREFMSDPARNRGGMRYGFLHLKVQFILTPREVRIEPVWK